MMPKKYSQNKWQPYSVPWMMNLLVYIGKIF